MACSMQEVAGTCTEPWVENFMERDQLDVVTCKSILKCILQKWVDMDWIHLALDRVHSKLL
jgi:hypothetical protein